MKQGEKATSSMGHLKKNSLFVPRSGHDTNATRARSFVCFDSVGLGDVFQENMGLYSKRSSSVQNQGLGTTLDTLNKRKFNLNTEMLVEYNRID